MGKFSAYNNHHVYPQSKWGSNERINIKSVKQKFHVDFHKVFQNMTPDEQYKFLLSFNERVHTKQFKKEFIDLINSANDGDYVYNQWVRLREKSKQLELH